MVSCVERLAQLHQVAQRCRDCGLCEGRTHVVCGEGPCPSPVMLVGEAPGATEDHQGRPFVGAAGQLLNELLASVDMVRQQVFITNVVKCRPPGNREPRPEEVEACRKYLTVQIRLLEPGVIVALGGPALRTLTGQDMRISACHGQPLRRKHFVLFPIFHPAAALHQPKYRDALFEDMKRLRQFLESENIALPIIGEQP